jgi:hypothetical protein
MIVDPCAVQERIPLWMGGRTLRSLRRAAALADGWSPFALTLDQTAAMLAKADIPDGFEVVMSAGHRLDPVGDVAGTKRALEELRQAGATLVNATFVHDSTAQYLEQLEALTHLVPSQEWTP